MDDRTKIAVLMIYYQHWGKEEIHLRKVAHGIQETEKVFRHHFHDLPNFLQWIGNPGPDFWTYLVDALLPGMNHYTPYDDLGEFRILCRRVRFADDLGTSFFRIGNASDDHMRRVDAIVAFPSL
jgi:hypothetical protein